jgi:hypothetical protein
VNNDDLDIESKLGAANEVGHVLKYLVFCKAIEMMALIHAPNRTKDVRNETDHDDSGEVISEAPYCNWSQ